MIRKTVNGKLITVGFNPNCDEIQAIIHNAESAYDSASDLSVENIYNWHKAFGDICMCRYMEHHVFKDSNTHIPSQTGKKGFYTRFLQVCEERNIDPNFVIDEFHLPDIITGYWSDGGEVSSDILIRLSDYLGVSIDYLLKGK